MIDLPRKVHFIGGTLEVMQERIGYFSDAQTQYRPGERDNDDENCDPTGETAAVENASLFGGEGRCGDDNAVEGQKRQCRTVKMS